MSKMNEKSHKRMIPVKWWWIPEIEGAPAHCTQRRKLKQTLQSRSQTYFYKTNTVRHYTHIPKYLILIYSQKGSNDQKQEPSNTVPILEEWVHNVFRNNSFLRRHQIPLLHPSFSFGCKKCFKPQALLKCDFKSSVCLQICVENKMTMKSARKSVWKH